MIKKYVYTNLYDYRASSDHIIVIPSGYGIAKITDLMLRQGIIKNALFFTIASKIISYSKNRYLLAGEYLISKDMNISQIINKLIAGDVIIHKVTLHEGILTSDAISAIINGDRIINDIHDSSVMNKQGILMTETYCYTYGTNASKILANSINDFRDFLDSAWDKRDKVIDSMITKEGAVILASIVERETIIDSERPRVAAVYLNRMKIKMKLQADPTVIFAVTNGQTFNHILSYADLKFVSPYNTYLIDGLPPGPICNPGKSSINAVLHPAYTDELYFVADGNGGHTFASNFNQHLNNVRKYRDRKK